MNQLVSNLSEKEYKELKEYLFNLQHQKYKRNQLKILRKLKFNFKVKKESSKLLRKYIDFLIYSLKNNKV
jgi:hypothetical protein